MSRHLAFASCLLLLAGCAAEKPYISTVCSNCLDPYSAFDNDLANCKAEPYRVDSSGGNWRDQKVDHHCLTRAYLALGPRLFELGDLGGSSRANWAALVAVGQAFSSRYTKEQQVHDAFEGLAKVAAARKQTEWSHLLTLCGALAKTYVDSPEGDAEKEAFDDAMEKIRAGRQAAMAAYEKAQEATWMQAQTFNLRAHMPGANVSADEALSTYQDVSEQNEAANDALSRAERDIAKKSGEVADVANEQFLEFEAGSRFAAERALYYLKATKDPGPYLATIRLRAKEYHWDSLLKATQGVSLDRAIPDPVLVSLAEELRALETHAVKTERKYAAYSPPPELAQVRAAAEAEGKKRAEARAQAEAHQQQLRPHMAQLKAEGKCTDDFRCLLMAECDLGDARRCSSLAFQLQAVEPKNPALAKELTQKACSLGDGSSCRQMERDERQAHVQKQIAAGECRDEYECQLVERCRAREKGGCSSLGDAYLRLDRIKDVPRGLKIIEENCAANDGSSCTVLAGLYGGGQFGFKQDVRKAIELWTKACDLQDEQGCFTAGIIEHGQDKARSKALFDKACQLGLKLGCTQFDEMEKAHEKKR